MPDPKNPLDGLTRRQIDVLRKMGDGWLFDRWGKEEMAGRIVSADGQQREYVSRATTSALFDRMLIGVDHERVADYALTKEGRAAIGKAEPERRPVVLNPPKQTKGEKYAEEKRAEILYKARRTIMHPWRPIATAPRNGSEFLLLWADIDGAWNLALATWRSSAREPTESGGGTSYFAPVGWMPRPTMPPGRCRYK